MTDEATSVELDLLIDELLAGTPVQTADAELAALCEVAAELRELSRDEFRERLARDLARAGSPFATDRYVMTGLGNVTPTLIVADGNAAIDFYERVFGASVYASYADAAGRVFHAKLRLGDSMLEIGVHANVERIAPGRFPPTSLHLYVPDVDALLARALAAGATGGPVVRQPYGDREAPIYDPFGITWWVGTHVAREADEPEEPEEE